MSLNACEKENFVKILKEELVPATGCTEPIAIAYAAATAANALGCVPQKCSVTVSGNILKNARCVTVPNSGGLKGIQAAAACGIVAGDHNKALDVLGGTVGKEAEIGKYLQETDIDVSPCDNDSTFFINVTVQHGEDLASAVIEGFHTNVVSVERNGKKLFGSGVRNQGVTLTDRSTLTVEKIVEFADSVPLCEVEDVLDRQVRFNSAICEEGLRGDWGANVGKIIASAGTPESRVKAIAAAGSDARMSGCDLPVVIVSGSGNQGMTASMPVVEYARLKNCDRERLLRALVVSNLITIHQKTGIGRLSAFCGAVSAGCGAAAGMAYVDGGGYTEIAHTVVNTLAIISGMICDGAKPSCAAKIAAAVDAGMLGYAMCRRGKEFFAGEGIVVRGVDNTIANIGELASEGMKDTDKKILQLLTQKGDNRADK